MLKIDKSKVDFLVTENMVTEVNNVLQSVFPEVDTIIEEIRKRKIDQVIFVACGSPRSACETAQQLFDKYSGVQCRTYSGWDFIDNPPYRLDSSTLVIGVSHYGKTEEVADSIKLAGKRGAMTIGISRDASGSPLVENSEFVIAYNAECIWEMHLLIAYYIACKYIEYFDGNEEVKKILADIPKIPSVLSRLVSSVESKSRELGFEASKWPLIYTVASGPLMPLAYKEGIITLMEFTWTHGAVLNSAEFRHGPLEVVEEGIPYIFLLGNDESRHTTERALNFVKRYTANIIVFDINDYEADLHPMLSPLVLFVPLDFFYFYLSINKDHNPDDRRYYGGLVKY